MRQEVVERGADLEQTLWTSLFDDLARDLFDESFPVGGWDVCGVCDLLAAGC
jgi:hypothetical protein